jgi:hypothetical protein
MVRWNRRGNIAHLIEEDISGNCSTTLISNLSEIPPGCLLRHPRTIAVDKGSVSLVNQITIGLGPPGPSGTVNPAAITD